ncbi:MAG: right-handed parallel beta-helix repeat-containing protein [Candidatus Thorarchaeota archaeon]
MKKRSIQSMVGFTACILFWSLLIPGTGLLTSDLQYRNSDCIFTNSSLTPHVPISVTGDVELGAIAVSGTGASHDPFILEGWNISTFGQDGIHIQDTTLYFTIRNCWVSSGSRDTYDAIEIDNAALGTVNISNTVCVGSYQGIDLDECENSTIINNQFYENRYGIWAQYCGGSLFYNNTSNDNVYYGIYVTNSQYSNITENICCYNNWNDKYGSSHGMGRGLYVKNCQDSIIYNNTCINNEYDGIIVTGCARSVIEFNNINGGHYFGIYLGTSPDCIIANNTATETSDIGIYASESANVVVADNTVMRNENGGFHVTHCSSANITDNVMKEDGLSVYGNTVSDYESMTISGNSINGKPFGFFLNAVGNIVSADYGQVLLVNCTNTLVMNQNCSYATSGVMLRWCSGVTIVSSTLDNNDISGIEVGNSNHTIVSSTSLSHCGQRGCRLEYSYNSTIVDSTISNNRYGFQLTWENLTRIENNTIADSSEYGLYYDLVGETSVVGNEFVNDGIYFPTVTSSEGYEDYAQTLSNNMVNGKPLEILFDLDDQEITEEYGQLVLVNANAVDIINKQYSNTVTGLSLISSNHCRVINTDVSGCKQFGFLIGSGLNNTISGCNCTYAGTEGIRVDSSYGDMISSNDCSFSGYGMRIDSDYGTVDSNICRFTGAGILVGACISPSIINNDCCNNYGSGITFSGTIGSLVQDNLCLANTQSGISLNQLFGGLVTGNNCSLNDLDGLSVFGAEICTFSSNHIYSNRYGIRFMTMSNPLYGCHVLENYIIENSDAGIYVSGGVYFNIHHNYLARNDNYGISIINGNSMKVHHCFFLDNHGGGVQASDSGSVESEWCDLFNFEGNYWSDHTTYGSYKLDGTTGAYDLFPFFDSDLDGDDVDDLWELENGLNPLTPDSDNDQIPDRYELDYGLDPLRDDSGEDLDGDNLTNLFEYQNGMKVNDTDSDSDSMDDFWEWSNNLNPLLDDTLADLDGDTLSNIDEYQHGTNPQNHDSDSDLIPDAYEVKYGLDPLSNDVDDDLDNDSLTNYQEFLLGLNPASNDTDNDLLPDAWEVQYYLNPLLDDSGWDPDGDGATNYDEYLAGTNPLVSNAVATTSPLMAVVLVAVGIVVGVIAMVVLFRWRFSRVSE